MRLLNLVAGLLLVSPCFTRSILREPRQRQPRITQTSSPSTSSSSGGSAIHSTPSSAPSSNSSSGGSHSAGSSGGFGSPSRHEHERDSSRDAASSGRHGRESSAGDTSSAKHHGKDSSPSVSNSRTDASTVRRAEIDRDNSNGTHEPKAARDHERGPTSDRADSTHADNIKVPRAPEDSPGGGDKHHVKCDKEPCPTLSPKPSPTPELSNVDWRQGRCQTGPCEPCPQGTVQGKNGTCVAKAPAVTCIPGTVRVGVSCVPAITTGQESGAAASHQQCGAFISQGNLIDLELASAREEVRSACSKSNTSADCDFAEMHLIGVRQRCHILRVQAPIQCGAFVPACI